MPTTLLTEISRWNYSSRQIKDLAQYRADNLALQEKIAGLDDTYKTLELEGDIADEERDDAIALEA